MTTNILLVRHGQTDSNVKDYYMGWSAEDLNETGYTQARRLSARLAKLPITAVYTSPLQRVVSTANILAEPHKLAPNAWQDLIEINVGDWQGLHTNEIKQKWPGLYQQWQIDPSDIIMPNGESLNEVTERAVRALKQILEANWEKQALIVTHDIIVKVIVAYALGVTNRIYRRFRISNASLTNIMIADGDYRILTLNDTAHLEGIPAPGR